jgi:hypothetical protein
LIEKPIAVLLATLVSKGVYDLPDLFRRGTNGDEAQGSFDLIGHDDAHLAGFHKTQPKPANGAFILRYTIIHLFHEINRLDRGRILATPMTTCLISQRVALASASV